MAIIKFIAEYTDGLYNYLALETSEVLRTERRSRSQKAPNCSYPECTTIPTCTLFDVESIEESMPFCKRHISMLDVDSEFGWSKVEDETPESIVLQWLTEHPSLFIEKAKEYNPEQSYNF